ncbi:hypothetical protein [Streptomyces sp. NPDC002132]|uniref:hypothetical protein n=1 Tax=unclassified Streptomyces TaxID=2593676 RepID=UPI00332A3342
MLAEHLLLSSSEGFDDLFGCQADWLLADLTARAGLPLLGRDRTDAMPRGVAPPRGPPLTPPAAGTLSALLGQPGQL